MKIRFNIEKKHLLIFVIFLSIIIVTIVCAYGSTTPVTMGHSAGELEVSIGGVTKTLQQAITDGSFNSLTCRLVVGPTVNNGESRVDCNSDEWAFGAAECETLFISDYALIYSYPTNLGHSWVSRCDNRRTTTRAMCCK